MEAHEVLNEKINMINHFRLYAQACQNQELKQMIDRHLQTAIQSYNQLIAYTHDYSAARPGQMPYQMPQIQPQQIQYGLRQPSPQTPQMNGRLNDPQIASAMLICHKNSAKNQMAASLECADPRVREMLVNGAVTCANQAYEVFLWMNNNGIYQVPTMQDHTAKTYLHSYMPTQTQPNTQPANFNQQQQPMPQ